MRDVSPGHDKVPVPPPVVEVPPFDQFCDLVMTGGVASGVVYPWAIVELARSYRFRNIGGTSVGAMAAVLAAAAEYGRRVGFDRSFEPLRRTPGALGEVLPDKRTRMLSLFQTNKRGRRLIELWGRIGRGQRFPRKAAERKPALACTAACAAGAVVWAFGWPIVLGALAGLLLGEVCCASIALDVLLMLIGALAALALALWGDIRYGLIENNLGLCKGGTLDGPGPEGKRPGLSEWLHEGIQASAGFKATDRPLTFRDLWCAPATPGAPHLSCGEADPIARRSINLQVITTNVTHGRPYRLPLADETSRLFYNPEELKEYFPKVVLDALIAASRPYAPRPGIGSDPAMIKKPEDFRELPGADLPVVVAARLSLSFPLLFSAVPLWAIDYEAERDKRDLRRCLFTDGGASSNFPIHLFDAAMPRWPTFGLWLDRRDPNRPRRDRESGEDEDVWLPMFHGEGWGDNWNRFDPEAADPSSRAGAEAEAEAGDEAGAASRQGAVSRLKFLFGFLGGIATSAVNWNDRTSLRLPHVRNRVARLRLERGQGGLHIGMSPEQILVMAHRYGTTAGKLVVQRFADRYGHVTPAWREQRWVRLVLLINGLRERLAGLKASAEWAAHTVPMTRAITRATRTGPIRERHTWNRLDDKQAQSLMTLLKEVERLEDVLQAAEPQKFKPIPEPELRLRAPL